LEREPDAAVPCSALNEAASFGDWTQHNLNKKESENHRTENVADRFHDALDAVQPEVGQIGFGLSLPFCSLFLFIG